MTERDLAVLHAVHAIELTDRAKGDESSPFFQRGNEAMATARDEAKRMGMTSSTLEVSARTAIAVFNRNERKILAESFPQVARDEYGFPYLPQKRRGW